MIKFDGTITWPFIMAVIIAIAGLIIAAVEMRGEVQDGKVERQRNKAEIVEARTEFRAGLEAVKQQSEDRFTETKALFGRVQESIQDSDRRSLERSLRLDMKLDKIIERELGRE